MGERADTVNGIVTHGESFDRIPGIIDLNKWIRALELDWAGVYRQAKNTGCLLFHKEAIDSQQQCR